MIEQFLDYILAIAIIITAAKTGGYISTRLGQPSVLGELLAGLILGPTIFDMFGNWPIFHDSEALAHSIDLLAELGVVVLMLLAGLELQLSELLRSGKVSAFSGTLGVVIPVVLGYFVSVAFGMSNQGAIFMGLTLAATSVSISAQTLMELKVLRSRVGLALLGAAVFDDILVILLLSIAIAFIGGAGSGLAGVGLTILGMVLYLALAIAVGIYLVPPLLHLVNRLPISRGGIAFVLVACLLYAWAAEQLGGMAAITGAFLIGLFIARTEHGDAMREGIATLAYGFLVPIFFVNIGLEVNMGEIAGGGLWFAIVITVVAILGKIIGCGVGGLLGGFSFKESLQLGIGMVSRGEVGLIVAAFSLGAGYMDQADFSVAVFMVIVATLVTPPLLRAVFPAAPPETPAATG